MREWFEHFLDPDNITDEDIIFTLEEGLRRVKTGWCQIQNALDKFGTMAWPESDVAVRWCATGAVLATNPSSCGARYDFVVKLWSDCFTILSIPLPKPEDVHPSEWTPQGQISGWNDQIDRTLDDVVELYETALIFARNPPPPPEAAPRAIMGVSIPTSSEWMARWAEAMRGAQQGDLSGFEEMGGAALWMM
jgi:hypothetical protein